MNDIFNTTNEEQINKYNIKMVNTKYNRLITTYINDNPIESIYYSCDNCAQTQTIKINHGNVKKYIIDTEIKCIECNNNIGKIQSYEQLKIEIDKLPKNHNRKWSFHDELKFCDLVLEGQNINDIATYFNRTKDGIINKAKHISSKYEKKSRVFEFFIMWNNNINEENKKIILNIKKEIENTNVKNKNTQLSGNNEYNTTKEYSNKAISWLNFIMKKENINIQHAENGGEYEIPGTLYTVDGYDKNKKTIYEFYGCYYHGCNKCTISDEFNKHKNKQNKLVYEDTLIREKKLKNRGYKVISIWECEYDKLEQKENNKNQFIEEDYTDDETRSEEDEIKEKIVIKSKIKTKKISNK